METDRIVIFAAIEMESRAILRVLPDARVYTVGIRAGRMPADAEITGAKVIIMAGLAGGLDPSLEIGDVILDDPEYRVSDSTHLRRGSILTTDLIIATPAGKAELFQKTKALAVEMEGTAARAFAARIGIPFISVRAISDTAMQTLKPEVIRFVDDFGKVKPVQLASGLLRNPGLIPYLNRLGRDSRLAARNLGQAVRKIVDALASG